MPKLDTLTLRVRDPEAQRRFYCGQLGMSDRGDGRVGYADKEASLGFVEADTPYVAEASDLYWKIALSVPNIDLAYEQLRSKGVPCTEPRQFQDVGYLAKVTDPEGFSVELIDHWFQGERPRRQCDETLLGGGAHLSLITLRTADIRSVEADLLSWGMKLLSIQPVTAFGFTLYFYAFTDETPPNPEPTAIENRTWTYRRPYTVLELQDVKALEAVTRPIGGTAGYGGLTVAGANADLSAERLLIHASRQQSI